MAERVGCRGRRSRSRSRRAPTSLSLLGFHVHGAAHLGWPTRRVPDRDGNWCGWIRLPKLIVTVTQTHMAVAVYLRSDDFATSIEHKVCSSHPCARPTIVMFFFFCTAPLARATVRSWCAFMASGRLESGVSPFRRAGGPKLVMLVRTVLRSVGHDACSCACTGRAWNMAPRGPAACVSQPAPACDHVETPATWGMGKVGVADRVRSTAPMAHTPTS